MGNCQLLAKACAFSTDTPLGQKQKWAASWQNHGMWAHRRLRSAWASGQSDQSLRCPHEESLGPYLPTERSAKTDQIRPGWSESSLGVHVSLLVLSRGGSNMCALKRIGMVGRHYHFILSKYFVWKVHLSQNFPPFFSIFDNICSHVTIILFRVGAKTYVGSGNLNTHFLP